MKTCHGNVTISNYVIIMEGEVVVAGGSENIFTRCINVSVGIVQPKTFSLASQ